MSTKVMLVVLIASSSWKIDNINRPTVAYHQIMSSSECAEISELLNTRQGQGAVCIPLEDSHE